MEITFEQAIHILGKSIAIIDRSKEQDRDNICWVYQQFENPKFDEAFYLRFVDSYGSTTIMRQLEKVDMKKVSIDKFNLVFETLCQTITLTPLFAIPILELPEFYLQ